MADRVMADFEGEEVEAGFDLCKDVEDPLSTTLQLKLTALQQEFDAFRLQSQQELNRARRDAFAEGVQQTRKFDKWNRGEENAEKRQSFRTFLLIFFMICFVAYGIRVIEGVLKCEYCVESAKNLVMKNVDTNVGEEGVRVPVYDRQVFDDSL